MSTPESIAEAFGRGLMQGMIGGTPVAAAQAPMVIPVEAIQATVKQAVHEMLDPILAEESPSAEQLDMFTDGIEYAEPDPIAERTLQRIHEANARSDAREEAMGREPERPTNYDPNSPMAGAPWMSPT